LSREAALNATPVRTASVSREERGEKLYVSLAYDRPRWQRLLGADARCRRTYGLDAYGREVYEACDGKTSVDRIVRRFARNHKLSRAEAETAVTTFMRVLMSRGLVVIRMRNAE
jgi:hypothetical protein